MNNEIKRIIIDEGHYTEANYPFTIKPNFSTLGSIIEISPQGPIIGFLFDDSMKDLLGFNARTLYEKYTPSDLLVNIFSFYSFFLECNIAQGLIFKAKRSVIIHNFAMDVDQGNKYTENSSGGVQRYMLESKDIISSICFELKDENGNLVSFNGQSVTFQMSLQEI